MSRKHWILLTAAVLALLLLVGAGGAAYIFVPRYQAANALAEARRQVELGNFPAARASYRVCLLKRGEDIAILEEYISVSLKIVPDRRRVLSEAGRAMSRLAQLEPDNPSRVTALMDFYRKHKLWNDLESTIYLFGGDDITRMTPEMAYDRAVAVHEQGRLADAIKDFNILLEQGGDLRDIPLRLARAHMELNEENAAEAVFPPLLEKSAGPGMLDVFYGLYLIDRGRLDDASARLAVVPEEVQGAADYHLASIRIALARNNTAGALAAAEAAIAQYPDNTDLQLNYIVALERAGERQKAVRYIEAMEPVHRVDTPGFVMFLTELRLEAGDATGADEARSMYADAYPDQQSVDQYLRGRILFARQLFKDARDRFAIASEMNPNLHRASYFLALCEMEIGRHDAARIPLEQYIRNNPSDQQARRLWTKYFESKPSIGELRSRANRLLSASGTSVDELLFTVEDLLNYRQEGEQQLTRQLLDRALAVAPGDRRVYSALAGYHLERNEIDDAERVLNQAIAAGIPESDFSLIRASMFMLRGDMENALATARAHLENATYNEVMNWAKFFSRQGYYREADQLFEAFTDVEPVPNSTVDPLAFRLSLAVQNGQLDDARARLSEAEAVRAGIADWGPALNDMRLALAEGLIAHSPQVPVAEIEEILGRVRALDATHNGLKIVEARLLMRGQFPDLSRARDLAASIPPESPIYLQSLQVLAEIAGMQGNHTTAEELSARVLESSPSNVLALQMLADAQLGQNNRVGARETLERVLQVDPANARALRLLVRLYEQTDLPNRADEMFARFKLVGRNIPGHAGQVEELRQFLNRPGGDVEAGAPVAEAADGNTYARLTAEVRQLLEAGNHPEALSRIRAYLDKNPAQAEPWVFLGQVILSQGAGANLNEASSAFTRAQIIIPEYGPALLGLIDVQVRGNNLAMAVSLSEAYLRNHDRDAEVMYRLAGLLAPDVNRRTQALEWLERAIAIEARPAFIRFRAFLLTQMGREDEAIEQINEMVSRSGGRATADDDLMLAEAYLAKGDRAAAAERVVAASRQIPEGESPLRDRLREIEARLASGESN